ncbi:MAG: AAA family ATPase [Phycisphaerales bacterium]
MRIKNIRLKNFKRFSDLTIENVPETAKLVVVVGPNGCGKSSLFDAMITWHHTVARMGQHADEAYYRKSKDEEFRLPKTVEIDLHNDETAAKGCLYVRTAYRNDPDFTVSGVDRPSNPAEGIRIARSIDNDQAVSENYRRLVYETTAAVYDESNDSKTVKSLREELIGSVRDSMRRVFGDLTLNNISDPLSSGSFTFDKGLSKSYHYKNLSGGEKAAFDIILDLHVKKRFFGDAIYCVDELEAHLHTRVQGALLREMVRILPARAQLWVTTHSLGVLRQAQEMIAADPKSVAVIDFDGVDPDISSQLMPSNVGRVTWEKMLSIALDDLSSQLAPEKIVVCEGSSVGGRRRDFDAEIYDRILGVHYHGILFVSGGSANQIKATGASVQEMLKGIVPSTSIYTLRDRDDLSDQEVAELQADGMIVLGRRNLESYLFADDVIAALVEKQNQQASFEEAKKIKLDAIAASVGRGNPEDDLKSASGEIYVGLKRLLGLSRGGNSTESFMRDTLAPLIVPKMQTYKDLKAAIIDMIQE